MPIDTAPRDGTPIAYKWAGQAVSTCVWLDDADEPGWWDIRAEEPATPTHWSAIVLLAVEGRASRFSAQAGEALSAR